MNEPPSFVKPSLSDRWNDSGLTNVVVLLIKGIAEIDVRSIAQVVVDKVTPDTLSPRVAVLVFCKNIQFFAPVCVDLGGGVAPFCFQPVPPATRVLVGTRDTGVDRPVPRF